MKAVVAIVVLSMIAAVCATVPAPAQSAAAKPPAPAVCPADSKRKDHCRAQAKVPKGKWAISQNAPWSKDYIRCLSTCSARDEPVARPKSFKSFFASEVAECKKNGKCKRAVHSPKKRWVNVPSLLQKAEHRATLKQLEKIIPNPIKAIEGILITVLRGVDLAEQVLAGRGKQIWQALACPACQCAVLKLWQAGCNKLAQAVCTGVSKVACGSAYKACNQVICPLIDPLFSSECMNIVNSLQQFDPFTATVPFAVCNTIHMCKPTDENLGEGLD